MTRYDCCMFYNENDLFEIRLNQHWDFIDRFVVVEAGETHTGLKKELTFDHARFEPWASKIEYRSFDSFDLAYQQHPELLDACALMDRGPNHASADWTRDHFQYNYMYKVLLDIGAQDDDIAYVACCDEIIKQEAFDACANAIANNTSGQDLLFMFKYWLYAYKFNMLNKDPNESDSSGGLCRVGVFKNVLPATLRDGRTHTHLINNAGWHFTFMDNTDGEKILAKQRAWAHSKDQDGRKVKFDNTTKEEALARLFADYQLKQVPIHEHTHPLYIINNQDKFKDYIYKS